MYTSIWAIALSCSIWTSSGVIVRYYNEINQKDYESFQAFSDAIMTHHDDNGVATTNTNILVGVAEPQVSHCFHYFLIWFYRGHSNITETAPSHLTPVVGNTRWTQTLDHRFQNTCATMCDR